MAVVAADFTDHVVLPTNLPLNSLCKQIGISNSLHSKQKLLSCHSGKNFNHTEFSEFERQKKVIFSTQSKNWRVWLPFRFFLIETATHQESVFAMSPSHDDRRQALRISRRVRAHTQWASTNTKHWWETGSVYIRNSKHHEWWRSIPKRRRGKLQKERFSHTL